LLYGFVPVASVDPDKTDVLKPDKVRVARIYRQNDGSVEGAVTASPK
jgi:hypothetical protein